MHQATFPQSLHLGGSVQVKERIKVVETRRLDAKRAHRGKSAKEDHEHIHRIEPVPLSDISALPLLIAAVTGFKSPALKFSMAWTQPSAGKILEY